MDQPLLLSIDHSLFMPSDREPTHNLCAIHDASDLVPKLRLGAEERPNNPGDIHKYHPQVPILQTPKHVHGLGVPDVPPQHHAGAAGERVHKRLPLFARYSAKP